VTPEAIPAYSELILPTVRAVADLGRSAKAREITSRVLESLPESEQLLAVTFPGRPEESVLTSRLQWARSYARLIGALESPSRGVFLLTDLGQELLSVAESEGQERVRQLDREFRRNRLRKVAGPIHAADRVAEAEEELPRSWEPDPCPLARRPTGDIAEADNDQSPHRQAASR
jgi:restriction system protein